MKLRSPPSRLRPAKGRFPSQGKERAAHYGTHAHQQWAEGVKRRAGFRCEECGAVGVKLYADHRIEISDALDEDRPDLLLDPDNGVCLCAPCHGRKTAIERQRRSRGF